MPVSKQKPILILARGFSARNLSAFELMLKGPGKGTCALSTIEAPEIAVVDTDGPDGTRTWADFRKKHPELPAIVLSVRDPDIKGTSYVSKPVRIDELLNALRLTLSKGALYRGKSTYEDKQPPLPAKSQPAPARGKSTSHQETRAFFAKSATQIFGKTTQLRATPESTLNRVREPNQTTETPAEKAQTTTKQEVTTENPDVEMFDEKRPAYAASLTLDEDQIEQSCGRSPDIDLNNVTKLGERTWTSKGYLLDYVAQAVKLAQRQRKPVLVDGMFKPLYILPNGNALMGLSDAALRSASAVPLNAKSINMKPAGVQEIRQQWKDNPLKLRNESLETFVWKLALWTSRGRLPVGTDVNQPITLTRWPNMTRLVMTPYAMSIAALLYDDAHSLKEVCTLLDVPQRFVFAFYSGAHTLGLSTHGSRSGAHTVRHLSVERKNFLQKILGRIGFQ